MRLDKPFTIRRLQCDDNVVVATGNCWRLRIGDNRCEGTRVAMMASDKVQHKISRLLGSRQPSMALHKLKRQKLVAESPG